MTDRKNNSSKVDDVHLLVATLPGDLQAALLSMPLEQLVEVVMDLGRFPEARFPDQVVRLSEKPVTHEDLSHVLALLGEFTDDNRAGIERTLHRISAIRNRKSSIIGLTLRVGRAIFGTIELLRDLIETGQNLLILGRPGVGKTTKLREMARVLADDFNKRVIVIDTSNEIAGDGDIPHPGIGNARRMQVPRPDRQHAVMIEAVENHMPEVIIVDEIGTEAEAAAARTIAERGVQLIGTAHGNTLENLIMNPILSDLVGGVQTVTLGDDEARRRGTTKTVSERKAPPTFDILIEMVDRYEVVVHKDTGEAVDAILRGFLPRGERRKQTEDGNIVVEAAKRVSSQTRRSRPSISSPEKSLPLPTAPIRIYPHGVSREILERAGRDHDLDIRISARVESADLIIALRSRAEDMGLKKITGLSDAPLHFIKRNTTAEVRRLLQRVFNLVQGIDEDEVREAVEDAEQSVRKALEEGIEVALLPRRPALRKVQHRYISSLGLVAQSVGREPDRHLVVYPVEKDING
ncbi:MAG TPA: R3H domain-containing nucleic acid-binding protein [Geobacteraceae bacterium]|nr:R3H domain-containing nucleic acid-binding protein [Geobacteraceae bacterium]